ncbi:MAG: hypothetical protein AB3N63_00055 [Puniceicoccaceae bacterium]
MTARAWWNNCEVDQEADEEIAAINQLEERISPISPDVEKIRELIGTLEMCHHKAERWVENIIEAIATGKTEKGMGSRPAGQVHPVEEVSKKAIGALSAWVAGSEAEAIELEIGEIPASRLLECLGERTVLNEWQVMRVVEKIRSWTDLPSSLRDPSTQYVWLVYGTDGCPDQYKEHEEFWHQTVQTTPFPDLKGLNGEPFSLGLAIDLLWTCHWKFVENLQIVLEVIGGTYSGYPPFAACAWNIQLSPIRPRMKIISNTLRAYCGNPQEALEIDKGVLARLGELSDEKKWLATSLDKTIRLQFGF